MTLYKTERPIRSGSVWVPSERQDEGHEWLYRDFEKVVYMSAEEEAAWLSQPRPKKSRPDLFPPRALALAGEVLAFGETKHPDEKWKSMSSSEHLAAVMRHYLEHQAGNTRDAETNKPHLAHALVRMAMALERSLDIE